MKKLLAAAVMAAGMTAGAFALSNSIDASFSVPMSAQVVTNFETSNTKSVTTYFRNGYGFDISDTAMLTDNIGLKLNAGFWWPQQVKGTTNTIAFNNSVKTESSTVYSDLYSTYFEFNGFGGIAINLKDSKAFSFTVVPGMNINFLSAKLNNSDSVTKRTGIGAGVDLVANLKLGKKLYVTGSCPVVWEFSRKVNDNTDDDFKGRFMFTPKAGLGYRF